MSPGRMPRIANIILGAWLAVSVLAWPHSRVQVWSSIVSGVVVVIASTIALTAQPRARYLTIAAGVWLVASSIALRSFDVFTVVHNGVVGTLIVLLGLVPVAETGRTASLRES